MAVEEELLEEEPTRSNARFIPWLLILGIMLIFVTLYMLSLTIEDMKTPLATEISGIQATLTAPPVVPEEEQVLTDELLSLRTELSAIESVVPTIEAAHIDWPAITASILRYDATLVRLTSFSHNVNLVTLGGDAMRESDVLSYAETLKQTGFFSRVIVQSITLNPVVPATPNPAIEPTEGAPALTELYMPFVFTLSVDLVRN
jgi:hypothetical protein